MSSTFLDHPRGLYVCFATELWERFSYYGMRALLIYYLTQHLLFSDEESYAIYGAYTALAWGLPVVGGAVADRFLGPHRAVMLGASLLSCGHLMLAMEGPAAFEAFADGVRTIERSGMHANLFFLSLALIATGVGFLKANISALVGTLYGIDDRRRDSGFTLFYLGINIGAAAAPILCGWLGQRFGWSYGFGAAGIGMLLGLMTFLRGQRHLVPASAEPCANAALPRAWTSWGLLLAVAGTAALVSCAWLLLIYRDALGPVLAAGGAALAVAIAYFAAAHCTPVERDRLLSIVVLVCFATVFWALYEQTGSSLNLFADRIVDRHLFGREIAASQLQALPAVFVIVLAPMFGALWAYLGRRNLNPAPPAKFCIALLAASAAFLMPMAGAAFSGPSEKIGLLWLAMTFMLLIVGELCVTPIALNMVTRLCPPRLTGMMVGTFLLSLSAGSFLAGKLAALTRVQPDQAVISDASALVETYTAAYGKLSLAGLLCAALLYALLPLLRRLMHDDAAR